MEDKRGTKRARSHSKEGSPSLSSAPTPPLAPFGSPPPLGFPLEVSSHCPCSPVFEQGGPSRKALIVDLSSSSNEEGVIPDTSRDVEFARRLFSDLNHSIFRPPGDGKVIILSDFNEEEEVHEEITADTDATHSSDAGIPVSTASTTDTDEPLKGVQGDNSDDHAPNQEADGGSNSGDKAGLP
jgi:hypothetical protein